MGNFAAVMQIIYYNNDTKITSEYAATIGVFDGVHQGHQHVIGTMKGFARSQELKTMVITFDRQPRQLFDAGFRPQLLTSFDEKIQLLSALDVDCVMVLPFTMEIAQLSAREFMQKVLKEQLNVKLLELGYDNRFGRGRTETFDDYVNYGKELGMKVYKDVEISFKGFSDPVSSSLIRRLIADEGNVNAAISMLTRPYQLSGVVKPGEHIGTTLGFPTANVEPEDADKLIPANGAYVVMADLGDGERKPAMMNIGHRPTFSGHKTTLEVNILDFEGDLYGKRLTVQFIERLRGERRFENAEALTAQLEEDKKQALKIISEK